VIDGHIEVASNLRKNEDLRIDQALKVVSMCLPQLFSFSAPLIRWPDADFKILTAVWLQAYKNAWNIGCSTAACLLTFPRENGGLQVKSHWSASSTLCGAISRDITSLTMAQGK